MSVFDEANLALTDACFDTFGDEASFTPEGGAAVATRAVLNLRTDIITDVGLVQDPRPSVDLRMAEVGKPQRGVLTFTVTAAQYALDRLIADDGIVARYFVRPMGAV